MKKLKNLLNKYYLLLIYLKIKGISKNNSKTSIKQLKEEVSKYTEEVEINVDDLPKWKPFIRLIDEDD